MTYREVISTLRTMGTAQNAKVYKRHGAGENVFGVSFANLNKLKNKIGQDHSLSQKLWASDNTDARTLAVMIADPNRFKTGDANRWIAATDYYLLADMVAELVSRTPYAENKMRKWIQAQPEYTR